MELMRGFAWEILPSNSRDAMVAIGHSGTVEEARHAAEEAMLSAGDRAGIAMLAGPGGYLERCRRTRTGGYRWQRA